MRWQEKFASTQDKELEAERMKLEKWADEEIEALKLAHKDLEIQYKTLKTAQENTGSFADKFKTNKALADLEKRRQQEKDKKEELAKIIKHKKDTMVAEAKAKTKGRFWDDLLFVMRFEVE